MRDALTYKRLVWIHRRLLIRASNRVGGKTRLVGLSKVVATVAAACSLVLLLAQGCATTPPPPLPLSQDIRAALGTTGVISVGPQLAADVSGPVGTGREAGRGALKGGAIGGLSGAGVGAVAGLFTGPCAPVLVPVFAGIGALGGGVVGAGTGAIVRGVNAIPTETADSLETALRDAMASRDLPAELRQRVLGQASMRPKQLVDLGAGNADPSAPPDYSSFAASGVHSVLEITITEVVFDGEGGRNPAFALSTKAQIRLIRVADNQVLWSSGNVMFRGTDADVSSWTAPESDHLAMELDASLERLAQQISEAVFVKASI
jgi:hypothetical protein